MNFIGPLTEKGRIFSNEEQADWLELETDPEILEFYTKQRKKINEMLNNHSDAKD